MAGMMALQKKKKSDKKSKIRELVAGFYILLTDVVYLSPAFPP
ncbi:hypothetical protein [Nitrosospira multiformis]|nr:hypothetical protein [Nitrosospira multiformis]